MTQTAILPTPSTLIAQGAKGVTTVNGMMVNLQASAANIRMEGDRPVGSVELTPTPASMAKIEGMNRMARKYDLLKAYSPKAAAVQGKGMDRHNQLLLNNAGRRPQISRLRAMHNARTPIMQQAAKQTTAKPAPVQAAKIQAPKASMPLTALALPPQPSRPTLRVVEGNNAAPQPTTARRPDTFRQAYRRLVENNPMCAFG